MGNQQPQQNQPFNPNFNLAAHNRRMQQLRHQYNPTTSIDAPGAFFSNRPKAQDMKCQQITRNVYLFKTSLEIHVQNGGVEVGGQYVSGGEGRLDVAVGVRGIQYDQGSNVITKIDCIRSFRETLVPTQPKSKQKFHKTYPLQQSELKQLPSLGIMIRITCPSLNEASQYSLSYIQSTKMWKVCLQNFMKDNTIFGIQDIYGGGQQGQECIICFCEKATTMVKPCNHLCLCVECSKVMQKQVNNCPICRKAIMSFVTLRKN